LGRKRANKEAHRGIDPYQSKLGIAWQGFRQEEG